MKTNIHRPAGPRTIILLIIFVALAIAAALLYTLQASAQARERDAKRLSDLKVMRGVVERYNDINGSYPLPSNGSGTWSGHCPDYGDNDEFITKVAPDYIVELPKDPRFDTGSQCYLYNSNGTDYMIVANRAMESACGSDLGDPCNSDELQAFDRPNDHSPSAAVYSPGARDW
ncbi:hypothetical protein JNJ66_00755 [Candidatus Saccharibacteria bacterium]|nr:hypothetical protein [Candidatus Saccharibacteria bacterium]